MTSGELGHSEEHRRLELALKVAGLGEFEWDMAQGFLMVSERMSAITGFPVGPMAATSTRDLQPFIHSDDWSRFRAELESQRPAGRT